MKTLITIRTTRPGGFGESHGEEKHVIDGPLTVTRLTGYLNLLEQEAKLDSITITEEP
ncbi:hypothetical protein [Bifidobacterium sp. ESL0745]|uniref:hypothetical protein n=1 Tax=Bifidobacterium sp. ESL0745 TaxID=2983226 RepID=UPI0023F66275|nr:hypothetical protein [Bifidobacterium sp. ESL0745]MDF7665713.1 hypothetical protein [Bifidobacterium sp. ESL0745]